MATELRLVRCRWVIAIWAIAFAMAVVGALVMGHLDGADSRILDNSRVVLYCIRRNCLRVVTRLSHSRN